MSLTQTPFFPICHTPHSSHTSPKFIWRRCLFVSHSDSILPHMSHSPFLPYLTEIHLEEVSFCLSLRLHSSHMSHSHSFPHLTFSYCTSSFCTAEIRGEVFPALLDAAGICFRPPHPFLPYVAPHFSHISHFIIFQLSPTHPFLPYGAPHFSHISPFILVLKGRLRARLAALTSGSLRLSLAGGSSPSL